MEPPVIFLVRLILGLLLAVMFGLFGLGFALLVIPPALAGQGSYVLARVALIGAGTGAAGVAAWSTWIGHRRHTNITLLLAISGGVGSALVSYTWTDLRYGDLGIIDQAQLAGRTTLVTAVVGANLLPALYSAFMLLSGSRPKS